MEIEIAQSQELIKENQELKTKIGEIEDNAEGLTMQIESSKMQMVTLKEKVEITGKENSELKQDIKRADKAGGKRMSTVTAMLYANIILNAMLLIVFTIDNPKAINEMLYSGKTIGLGGFILISEKLYGVYDFLNKQMYLIFEQSPEMTSVYTNVICGVIVIILAGIGVLVGKWLIRKSNHSIYYKNKGETYVLLKKLISFDIVIVLYAIYVTQFETIRLYSSDSISMAIWGIITVISLLFWNVNDFLKGFSE